MKKISCIFIILLLSINLIGCNLRNYQYINFSVKPNNHYYIDEIKNKILNNKKFTLYVFDTNLYKEIEVPADENSIFEDFISSLATENYSTEGVNVKEPFRIRLYFNDNDQYFVKVFNDSIISVAPWDGIFNEDIISMKNLPLRYNLFDFCNHIENKPIAKQN
ncbi:hypothetical protein CDLVIII_2270 [Clostridium sp. DL-VIII]|uniref:DUF4883 family protein n=1 Tax=Clostridium sp. DL-VIII TaxID=641107 RepID=UPI00023AFCB4|nr:DUF4883 family protein [Clostridium sp. DL-VIII]EHI98932.1 hypothetical protein CDLVIII_2270 [Clostridium sp. DL-VIII]